MMKLKTNAFTEKGIVRTSVRNAIVSKVASDRAMFAKAEQVDNKGQFYIEVEDANGEHLYVNFAVTVSRTCISESAQKVRKVRPQAPVEFE